MLSGVLLALSFPKYGHGAVAWVALVPLLVALHGAPDHGLRLGYLTGAVASLGIVYWTALVVVQYGGLSLPLGFVAMLLLCLALALFPALFGLVAARWIRSLGTQALLVTPTAWVATEALRAYTLFNFSWCLLGYSQQANLHFIQVARFTAVYGVSFLVASVSAVLAYMAIERRPRPRRLAGLTAAVVLGLVWMDGWRVLGQRPPEQGRLRVGLVQAAVLQEDKWDADKAWGNIHRHFDLTRRAAAGGARLVVWPESALPFYYDRSPQVAEQVRQLVRQERVYLLFGNDDRQAGERGQDRVYVGAKMLDPGGELVLRYHKMRLVPFGEYVPLAWIFTLGGRFSGRLVQGAGDFAPGRQAAVAAVDGQRLGAFICYEAIFPDQVRRFVVRGADLLVNITNDAWYGHTSAPYQHMAMAVFRAVENGKYLVRAANTGISGVVDPRGRVLERTRLFEPVAVVRDVPIVPGLTFYARHGDVFAWSCLGAALALTAATFRRS